MENRRQFLKLAGTTGFGLWAAPLLGADAIPLAKQALEGKADLAPSELAKDEDFWGWVRHQYPISGSLINLNNGGVSPHPSSVSKAVERYTYLANEAPSFYMWRTLESTRKSVRKKLANLAGVSHEEIAIHRNTTEALDTVIFGIDLQKGDEVVHSNFIYPNMNQAWAQREMRDGVVRKIAKLPMPSTDEEALVKSYTDLFTKKTKVVHITHLINWTGQVMPVRPIADAAKSIGAKVIVDGAHTFAHLDFKIPDLNCDYFGTSLHKWLSAPFGTGMLYVQKDHIADLWPLFPNPEPKSSDILKFESLGTRNIPAEMAIGQAVDFHEVIGSARKFARLHYLKQYWVERVKDVPGIRFWCPEDPAYSGALTTFGFEGDVVEKIPPKLMKEAQIHSTVINHEGIYGCRITPHIYTNTKELDRLVDVIHSLV